MRTNIDLEESLLKRGLMLTKLHTKKALVNYALMELIRNYDVQRIFELEGKIEWTGDLTNMRKNRL